MKEKNDLPTYSDEEFDRKSRELWTGYRRLHEETLRNPSYNKVRRLVHDMMTLVNKLAEPVNNSDELTTSLYYQYEDNRLGTQDTRATRNEYLREYASSRYMWPCVVEIHKGMSGMTFPRSKDNSSGLEKFLTTMSLGESLPGKATGYNNNEGTTFSHNGKRTFSGYVINEIETIMLYARDCLNKQEKGEDLSNLDQWLKTAMDIRAFSSATIDAWLQLFVDKIKEEYSGHLEHEWELFQHLQRGFEKWRDCNGGGSYEGYVRKRVKAEMKKIAS
ncbi:hypothetical protein NT6N_30500 [Oceaniferula spumae]|uniref:Uncharacterized protein n=1 Tax=Oceaniferula spumae TaxID=2979115 RepID=A0AAT9FPT4_9BACT